MTIHIDLVPDPSPVIPPKAPPAVVLELTREQARLLATVLGCVNNGIQYSTAPLYVALHGSGFAHIPDCFVPNTHRTITLR